MHDLSQGFISEQKRRLQLDKITIHDLEIYAHHGVLQEETVLGQKFLVSIELWLDTQKAGKTDNLQNSVSYAEVSHFVNQYLQEHTYQLLEAAAEHTAEELLKRFPIEEVTVEIKKPWAPILLPMDTVSVAIHRKWHSAFLSIGSNVGDTEANLNQAVAMLKEHHKIRVIKISDFIVTEPYGGVEQDDFLNGALVIQTLLSPHELLDVIGTIEKALKRERVVHWGPRTIDLDILLYDDLVVNEPDLIIPHIEMHLRDFVLRPLAQIAPQAIHPLLGKNVYQLFWELQSQKLN